jgi:hypothetical protein
MAQTQPETSTKLVLEIDITEALKRGELGPGYPGNNEHTWTEEQTNYIIGFVLRQIGEDLLEDANQPCIDYADHDAMDYREGLFDSASYNEENVVQGSPEDNLMDMQESALSVALEIANKFLVEAKARGMDITKFEDN